MRHAPLLAIGLALLLGACGTTEEGPLHIDVVKIGDQVFVYAYEVGASSPCDNAFPRIGVSDQTTDAPTCWSTPAPWLDTVSLADSGQVLETKPWDPPHWPGFDASTATDVVLADDDGNEVRITLPTGPQPQPTILRTEATGGAATDTEWTIEWFAPGAASAVVGLGGGLGGPREHVEAGSAVTLEFGPDGFVWVEAFAPSVEVATDFGTAHLWYGAGISRELSSP